MIGLKTSRGWLDLLPGTVGIEISNPYFRYDAVPGVTTYPFGLPMTPVNLRHLNFPHVLAAQGELPAPEPVEFYLDGLLWRVGSLVYQEYQPDKRLLQYKFVAGAADLQSRIDGLQLGALSLGQVPLELRTDAPDYALGTIRNPAFYGDKHPAYSGYLNQYAGGYTGAAVAPQPRLVPLLHRVLAAVGYTVSGAWLSDVSVQQLVAYSDRVAEDAAGVRLPELVLSRHVPAELKVGALLVELQKLFGLGYDFDLARRELRMVRLREVALDDEYLVRDAGQLTRALPTAYEGYSLEFSFESEDEQLKGFDNSWAKLVLGAGKTSIKAEAGTLHCLTDAAAGQFMPHIVAKGASPAYGLGDDSRCGLRLLFDRGLQGGGYPQLTNGREAGSPLALQWAGDNGLYAQCHQSWLELLARAGSEERVVPFRVGDLLSLNPGRKELLGPRKYLWEKMSLTASTAKRLESARVTYRPVRR